ncbi:hypothetical protein [Paenirhodobacter sp.]|uniref:hypothetical protein n=1 Tax=Paenirhodobacter sp. TaxID=1965326 RepID=UPI003B400FA1
MTVLPPLRGRPGRISAVALIALILLAMIEALFPTPALRMLARGLLLVYLALEWRAIQRNGRIMVLIAAAMTAVALLRGAADMAALGRALDQGVFLATFFANQFFLREPARRSALVRRCAGFFIDQMPARRYGLLTLGGYLFGIILNMGVLSLLGLMIRQRNTLASAGGHEHIRTIRERRMVLPLLRGFSVTPLGSPISIAMVVLLTVLPGVDWLRLLGLGLMTGGIVLVLGWALDHATAPRHLAHLLPPVPRQRGFGALAGVIGIVLGIFALALSIEGLAGLPLNRAVLAALPLAGLIWLAAQHRRFPAPMAARLIGRRLVREGTRTFPRFRTEIAILSSAGFIGTLLSALVPPPVMGAALMAVPLHALLLPGYFTLLVLLAGLAGLNPIVTVSILGAALAAVPAPGVPRDILALALMAGWTLTINASAMTASSMIVGDLVNRSAREVTLLWNGRFALLAWLVLSGWFALLVLLLDKGGTP